MHKIIAKQFSIFNFQFSIILLFFFASGEVRGGSYELTINYKVVGSGHETCGDESRVELHVIFSDGGSERIKYDRMQLDPGDVYTNTVKYIFTTHRPVLKVKVYSCRKYRNSWSNCVTADDGEKETGNFTLPASSRTINGLVAYGSQSSVTATIKPVANKKSMEFLTEVTGGNPFAQNKYTLHYSDNTKDTVYTSYNPGVPDRTQFVYDANKIAERLVISYSDTELATLSLTEKNAEEPVSLPGSLGQLKLKIKYQYMPRPKQAKPGTEFSPDLKDVELKAVDGFPAASIYWHYCLDDNLNTWTPIRAPYQYKDIIEFTGRDIFGNATSNLWQKIHFRYHFKDVTDKDCASEIVTVLYQKDAPTMTLHSKVNTKCSYAEDGEVTAQFSRALVYNERLSFTLLGVEGVPDKWANITLDHNNRHTFRDLPKGTHTIKIHTAKIVEGSNEKIEYSSHSRHSLKAVIDAPEPVTIDSISHSDVNCHGGTDGRIYLNGAGGTEKYYIKYHGNTTPQFLKADGYTITNLSARQYELKLYDSNHCKVRNAQAQEIGIPQTLSEPTSSVKLVKEQATPPRGFGLTDGTIIVYAQGGNSPLAQPYTFTWQHDGNAFVQKSDSMDYINERMFSAASKTVGDGMYHIRVTDSRGCADVLEIPIVEPPRLEVALALKDSIRCFGEDNGSIIAHATGGVGGYTFNWYKKPNHISQNISNGFVSDSLQYDLVSSPYYVIVKDLNGIESTSADFPLSQPNPLQAQVDANTLACDGDTSGWVQAVVTGGNTPYRYLWATPGGDSVPRVENLTGGSYFVFVTDRKACETHALGRVAVPNGMETAPVVNLPICHNSADGSILLGLSGGVAPYRYLWNNGATANSLAAIASGTYEVTITDHNNCFIRRAFTLDNPPALIIDLGGDKTLCRDQQAMVSATIADPLATYRWYNSYGLFAETSEVTLSNSGDYRVEVSDSNGCTGQDGLHIETNDTEIIADFLAASSMAATIPGCIVNISHPAPEQTEWIIPQDQDITIMASDRKQIELRFDKEGTYNIGLRSKIGNCEQTVFKEVIVVGKYDLPEYDPDQEAFLKQFKLWPNPSNGQFTVLAELREPADIQLQLVSINGSVVEKRRLTGKKRYEEPFSISDKVAPGVYILQLVSQKAVAAIQIIIEN